jgi:hypothetical protein
MRRMLISAAKAVAADADPVGLDRHVSTGKISGAAATINAFEAWTDLVPGNVMTGGGVAR